MELLGRLTGHVSQCLHPRSGPLGGALTWLALLRSSAGCLHACPGPELPSRRSSEGLCGIFCAQVCCERSGVHTPSCTPGAQCVTSSQEGADAMQCTGSACPS